MATNDLLTVKEVAEALHISRQAVYSRLDKDFQPYLTIKNGKRLLSRAVLQEIKQDEVSSNLPSEMSTYLTETLQLLKAQNEILSKELNTKNEQIKELNERLAEAHKMAENAQQLHGADKALELQEAQDQKLTPAITNKKKWQFWKK